MPLNPMRVRFVAALCIILVVCLFALFPRVLLRWIPISAWMVIFLVGIAVFVVIQITLSLRQGLSIAKDAKRKGPVL